MPNSEFEKLVKEFAEQQKKTDEENAVDWAEMREWWIQTAKKLFDQIDGWLESLIKSGSVKSNRTTVQLTESDLGKYDISCLELQVASRKLTFTPEGTMLIGAFGRIEVKGPQGQAVLLLITTNDKVPSKERRNHVDWFIAPSGPSLGPSRRARLQLSPLTQEAFQQLFTDLLGVGL